MTTKLVKIRYRDESHYIAFYDGIDKQEVVQLIITVFKLQDHVPPDVVALYYEKVFGVGHKHGEGMVVDLRRDLDWGRGGGGKG
ncbi:MAG: hypothetical protein AAF264_12655 [Pseudomonadota bacterium]